MGISFCLELDLLGFLGCSAGASAAAFASTGFSVGDFMVEKIGMGSKNCFKYVRSFDH